MTKSELSTLRQLLYRFMEEYCRTKRQQFRVFGIINAVEQEQKQPPK